MKLIPISIIFVWLVLLFSCPAQASCSYDHLVIGCNPDSEPNTPDDNILYLDTCDLYRRSDPDNRELHTWLNWYYTFFPVGSSYYIAEPGFGQFHHPDETGTFQFEDPNRCLVGTKNVDYRIMVECVDISGGFEAYISLGGSPVLTDPNDTFNHSSISDSQGHMHLYYFAPDNGLHWITYRIYDAFFDPEHPETGYRPSNPITVVFGSPPSAGDIHVDGSVDILDLKKLAAFWLRTDSEHEWNDWGQAKCDLFDRADINRDYSVDLHDYQFLSKQWNE